MRSSQEPSAQALAQGLSVDEVGERGLPVDLDLRQELSIPLLELGSSGDVDELELEREVLLRGADHLERSLAEAAVGSVVDGDPVQWLHGIQCDAAAKQPPSGISR